MKLQDIQTLTDLNLYMDENNIDLFDMLKDDAAVALLEQIFGKSEVTRLKEFGVLPQSLEVKLAEEIAASKGFLRRVPLESQSGVYTFVSIESREGSRCIKKIHANSHLEAAKKLTEPEW